MRRQAGLATSADEQSLIGLVNDEDRHINRSQICYHDNETLMVRRGGDRGSDIVSISSSSKSTNRGMMDYCEDGSPQHSIHGEAGLMTLAKPVRARPAVSVAQSSRATALHWRAA